MNRIKKHIVFGLVAAGIDGSGTLSFTAREGGRQATTAAREQEVNQWSLVLNLYKFLKDLR